MLQSESMTQPLALVLYEKLLPGTQLVNRLHDMNYRVETISDPDMLVRCAEQAKPLLVLADLQPSSERVRAAIASLKSNPATNHLPVIIFTGENAQLDASSDKSGATLLVSEAAILNHLPQILEQALEIDQ
jgi:CheY-like chemotaxis protein